MSTTHKNNFNEEYLSYIKNIDSNKISGLSFLRSTHLNTLIKIDNEIKPFDSSVLMPLPESLNDDSNLMFENFDLLYGTYPKNSNELVLIVNEYNEVDSSIFNALGFKENDTILEIGPGLGALSYHLSLYENDVYLYHLFPCDTCIIPC